MYQVVKELDDMIMRLSEDNLKLQEELSVAQAEARAREDETIMLRKMVTKLQEEWSRRLRDEIAELREKLND